MRSKLFCSLLSVAATCVIGCSSADHALPADGAKPVPIRVEYDPNAEPAFYRLAIECNKYYLKELPVVVREHMEAFIKTDFPKLCADSWDIDRWAQFTAGIRQFKIQDGVFLTIIQLGTMYHGKPPISSMGMFSDGSGKNSYTEKWPWDHKTGRLGRLTFFGGLTPGRYSVSNEAFAIVLRIREQMIRDGKIDPDSSGLRQQTEAKSPDVGRKE
ncbi:MAG: hypothetical protein ABL949_15965 [Fimbriimonadaceae bacterium]